MNELYGIYDQEDGHVEPPRTKGLSRWVGRMIKKRRASRSMWGQTYVQPSIRKLPTLSGAEIAKHVLCKQRKWILLSDRFKHYCFTKGHDEASKARKGTLS